MFFFFNDTATTEIYTLSLHDALPIYACSRFWRDRLRGRSGSCGLRLWLLLVHLRLSRCRLRRLLEVRDRKSTRLNSSHANISYAVFCLKKKKKYTSLSSNHIFRTQSI